MNTARTVGLWLVELLLIGRLLERNVVAYPRPTLGPLQSALILDVLQELIHQSYLLRKGTCQIWTCRDRFGSPFGWKSLDGKRLHE